MEKIDHYKVALLQMDLGFLNVDANLEKAEQKIREAANQQARIICLPEAFNTGYYGNDIPSMAELAEEENGKSLTTMCRLAQELKVYLIAPIILKTKGAVTNTAFLIDDQGKILGKYSKTHPVGDEQKYFQRGKEYPVWDTPLGKIGIVICYDVCFPETIRLLALNGAEIVFVPAAWRASHYFKEWWDINIRCRALDNLVYMLAVNRAGQSGIEIFAGKSQICNPIGEVEDTCGVQTEGILYGTIEPSRVARERKFNTVLQDRHIEDYLPLSQK